MATGIFALVEESFNTLLTNFKSLLPNLITLAITVAIIAVIYYILTKTLRAAVIKTVKREQEREIVLKIWRYVFLFIALLVVILSFSGSLAAAGISIGLLSAALGWALQKPITGIAAWLMILVKRPFKVGDRVIVDNIKGDIKDITMFYIVLNEFGGTIGGEESSGRTILIPTSLFFEKPITNYTIGDAYILDEVGAEYTYQSNLPKVEKIMLQAAEKFAVDAIKAKGSLPFTRVFFNPNGMHVRARYYVLARDRQKVMTDITREIYSRVMQEKDTEFAYPHTEVVFTKKSAKGKRAV